MRFSLRCTIENLIIRKVRSLLVFLLIGMNAFGQSESISTEAVKEEYNRLLSIEFNEDGINSLSETGNPSPQINVQAHHWKDAEDEFNFVRKEIPSGARLLVGDPEVIQTLHPENWDLEDFYLQKHVFLSPQGQVLEYMNHDSTVNYYDASGNLRQSIVYSLVYPGEVDFYSLYGYSASGNILWRASFLDSKPSTYLNQYETYRYYSTDSGMYVRHDIYSIFDEDEEPIHSINFDFYNSLGLLVHSYSGDKRGIKNYVYNEYQQIDGKFYTSRIVEFDVGKLNGKKVWDAIILRDDKARIVLDKTWNFIGDTSYITSDSTVYISDREKHVYKKTDRGPYTNALLVYKLNEHGHEVRREIYDLNSDTQEKIEILTEYENVYLDNGSVHQVVHTTYWDGRTDVDLYIYEFLSDFIGFHDPTYQDDPFLIRLIERSIPLEKR